MKRELRANLFHKTCDDYDIENAFPCILRGVLEMFKIDPTCYARLVQLSSDREDVYKEIMRQNVGWDRDKAKRRCLAILFKDPEEKWTLKSEFEKKFQDEMKEVADMVLEKEADDWVARSQKKHAGAGLAVFLQTQCAIALDIFVKKHKDKARSLIMDGCLVEKNAITEQQLTTINTRIQEDPKFKYVKFVKKDFKVIDTKELPVKFIRNEFNNNANHQLALEWSDIAPDRDLDFETVKDWSKYKTLLVDRLNTKFAMASQGSGFQKTVVLIKGPSNINPDTGNAYFPGYSYTSKDVANARQFYENETVTVSIKELRSVKKQNAFHYGVATFKLFDLWYHGRRISFENMDYNPRPLGEKGAVLDTTFNRFHGFRITRKEAKMAHENGDEPNLIKEFIMHLCNDDKVIYDYVFAMLAFVLQVPWMVPGILLVIQGEKGIGKTLLYSILEHILGDVNCTSISDIEQLVGRFNDKRKDKKLVCLEEIGSSVYDPKNWSKIKDMITSGKGSFDAKHKAIEDSPSFTFFMQLTNDEYCVRVDPQGVRRIFLINANNYWSKQQCQRHGRMAEREAYFSELIANVFEDRDGCLSSFAHFLYEYPLKKVSDRVVRLEHYNVPCKALHEQAMRSLTIPGQMVLSWIQGEPVWVESIHLDPFYHYISDNAKLWVPRNYVYGEYVRRCNELRRKARTQQNFWFDMKTFVCLGDNTNKTIDKKEERGLYIPCKNEMIQKFRETYPGFDVDQI
eukprot:g6289.t1